MSAALQQALALHQRGQLVEAERLYLEALRAEPANPAPHYLFGVLRLQQGRMEDALAALDRAIALDANNPDAHGNRARALHMLGRQREALASYDRALKLNPQHFSALVGRGSLQREMGRPDPALADYDKALALRPGQAEMHYNCALALADMGRLDDALARLERAVALKPDYADAWSNRGCVLQRLHRTQDALASFDRALAHRPQFPDALHNRGSVTAEQGDHAGALLWYDRALALAPALARAWNDRGVALNALRRRDEALESFRRALALEPGLASAHNNRGTALWEMGRIDEALVAFDAAIAADPKLAVAFYNRGSLLWARKQAYDAAVRDLESTLALEPDYPFARGHLLHLKMYAGDWHGFAEQKARLDSGVRAAKRVAEPFAYMALSDSPADLLACAKIYAADKFPSAPAVRTGGARQPGKIRLGYVSGEFREQATAFLTAGLYEHHDKTRFELFAFDNGGPDAGAMRRRLEAAFDHFVDISALAGDDAARAVAARDIDILVNLNGYFGKMRPDLFARRPAPLQVNYLGFPGSMGAATMDYIIADAQVIPPGEERFYSERVVRLPHSYQVTDSRRGAATPATDRAAHGLPADAFVFCYFNQSYKITPDSFGAWMRILARVPNSVLWLFENNPMLADNLRREAEARGIAASRLIFAPYLEQELHLARLPLGDLFLDSLPYGAHTTASDALWAGLPLITRTGSNFAGRVATSLLHAIGLPELIAPDAASFEALAVTLASDPARLAALRKKLAAHRATTPLFDTAAFARALEQAYVTMLEMRERGEAPRGFDVSA